MELVLNRYAVAVTAHGQDDGALIATVPLHQEDAMWGRGTRLAMALGLGLAVAGCASETDDTPKNAFGEGTATVVVQNNNWADMTVYAVRNGLRMRLGMVVSMGAQRFKLPRNALGGAGDLRLLADPIGSDAVFRTQPLLVAPGQLIEFTLQNNLAHSTSTVW
ncbi:MAG TPA: hypothetical protein VFZ69_10905 [Longimicrobiales bacterium]